MGVPLSGMTASRRQSGFVGMYRSLRGTCNQHRDCCSRQVWCAVYRPVCGHCEPIFTQHSVGCMLLLHRTCPRVVTADPSVEFTQHRVQCMCFCSGRACSLRRMSTAAPLRWSLGTLYSCPDTSVTSSKKSSSACKPCGSNQGCDLPHLSRQPHRAAGPRNSLIGLVPDADCELQSPVTCATCAMSACHRMRTLRRCRWPCRSTPHTSCDTRSAAFQRPVSCGGCQPDRLTGGSMASGGGVPSVCAHCLSTSWCRWRWTHMQ